MSTKPFYKSKTFWFNVVTGALAIAQTLQASNKIPVEYLATIMAVGNLIIRIYFTETKIK